MGKDAEVPLVGDAKDPKRIAKFGRKVAMVINSLIRGGFITRVKGPTDISGNTYVLGSGTSVGLTLSDGVTTVLNVNDILFTSGATLTTPGLGQADIAIAGGGGSGWEHPFTKPTVGGVAQVNTTGFTATDDTNGLFLWRSGALSASDNLSLAHLAIPSGAWSNTIRIQSLWGDDGFAQGGAHLYESGTGKIITWGCQGAGTGQRLCVNQFNSITSFSSQPKSIPMTERPTWLRITYDGTANYTFFWSMDGYSWVIFGGNLPKTSFFTTGATHAGFFLNPNTSAIVTGVKCMSLVVS